MRAMILVLAVLGCQHHGPKTPKPDGSSDSGTPGPRQPGGTLPPSASLTGLPGMLLGADVVAASRHGDNPSVLILDASTSDTEREANNWPKTFVVPGHLPPGDTALLDWWDGVSGHDDYYSEFPTTHAAGDVNDDGHLDVWVWDRLYLGPLLGRRWTLDNADAFIPVWSEFVVAAGFDADGDGHEDAVFKSDGGHRSYVRYGPFSGELPSADEGQADPTTYSTLGADSGGCSHSLDNSAILRDHLGPGRDAVAIGADVGGDCSDDGYIWDLQVPRGTHLGFSEVVGKYDAGQTSMMMDDAGDVDGDGFGDATWYPGGLFGYGVTISLLLKGPIDTSIGLGGDWPTPVELVGGVIVRGVGDINGDGQPELLGIWRPDPTNHQGRWMILFSPHADPLDLTTGLELGSTLVIDGDYRSGHLGLVEGDLDGDGLADLIGWDVGDQYLKPGVVNVWYSGDLLEAWEAYQASLPRD